MSFYPELKDDERPVWLDIGTLRDEKMCSFYAGGGVTIAVGWLILMLVLLVTGCQPVTSSSSSTTMLPPVLAHPAIQKVTKEVDGDSLYVDGVEVRLIGIDTPETKKPGTPIQCYGPEASAHTAAQVPVGTPVLIVYDSRNGTKPDKYGRPLVYLYRQSDGLFLNLDLAKEGFARNAPYPNTRDHAAEFKAAAAEAQQEKRGLWGKC